MTVTKTVRVGFVVSLRPRVNPKLLVPGTKALGSRRFHVEATLSISISDRKTMILLRISEKKDLVQSLSTLETSVVMEVGGDVDIMPGYRMQKGSSGNRNYSARAGRAVYWKKGCHDEMGLRFLPPCARPCSNQRSKRIFSQTEKESDAPDRMVAPRRP